MKGRTELEGYCAVDAGLIHIGIIGGLSDGAYPIYVKKDRYGVITEIKIIFVDEEEE